MEQKVIKVGNSLAVTLPRHFIKERRIKPGQMVFVEADADLDLMQIKTKNGKVLSLTPEFKQWLDQVSTKYEKTIKELANK